MCITADNKIISGSDDCTVRIWDMHGNQLAQCNGHRKSVCSVCITTDNKIISGSADCTIRVWDMHGNQLAQCIGHRDAVDAVCITSDSRIVSGGYDRTICVWDISLLNRISTMDFQEAQAVWHYLQSEHAKNWDRIRRNSDANSRTSKLGKTNSLGAWC